MQFADRVQQITATTGTGAYTLGSAASGVNTTFAAAFADGVSIGYCCQSLTDYEVGIGTLADSGTTLHRDTILASSNNGNAVDWPGGDKEIFCTVPAACLPTYATTNPTVTTNPPMVGAKRINIISGEEFICTDNTVDNNVWKGSGGQVVNGVPKNDLIFEQNGFVGAFLCDSSGCDNHARLNGAATVGSGIIRPYCLQTHDGSDHADTGITDINESAFSVSCWINVNNPPSSDWVNFVDKGDYQGTFSCGVKNDSTFRFAGRYTDDTDFGLYNVPVPTGWSHCCVVVDSSEMKIFIDNVEKQSQTLSMSLKTTTIPIRLGYCYTGTTRVFDGRIDGLRIYNRALTAAEITALYNEGT